MHATVNRGDTLKNWKMRSLGTAAVAFGALVASGTSASAADTWLPDPANATGQWTAKSEWISKDRVAQLRVGNYDGAQYGWAKAWAYGSEYDWIRLEVDLDGDRKFDAATISRVGYRIYTASYKTSTSSKRAFRACVIVSSTGRCSDAASTDWW